MADKNKVTGFREIAKGNTTEHKVTSTELREAFGQFIEQYGQQIGSVQEGLVDAINSMYANQVFPFQLEIWALEKLLIEKGFVTEDEINAKVDERKKDLLSRAQAIKENADGQLEKMTEEEADIAEKTAVVKAHKSTKKKDED